MTINRDQVIAWAREAGIGDSHGYIIANEIEHLEALVKLAREDMRGQCAMVCESEYDNWDNEHRLLICANAIRKLEV